jgi:hypothetical protein
VNVSGSVGEAVMIGAVLAAATCVVTAGKGLDALATPSTAPHETNIALSAFAGI